MPWRSLREVPRHLRKLRGVELTLAQINWIARLADELVLQGYSEDQAWAIARARFMELYRIVTRNGRKYWARARR